jgi:hypothetical protein
MIDAAGNEALRPIPLTAYFSTELYGIPIGSKHLAELDELEPAFDRDLKNGGSEWGSNFH